MNSLAEVSSIVTAMKQFSYEPTTLPLCAERTPFEHITDDLCAQIAHEALTTPERRGRLTDIVRTITGQTTDEPTTYTTIEAHIGLSFLDPELLTDVLALGFEPHHFAGKQPTGYDYNFTQQFILNRPGTDYGRLRSLLRRRTEDARKVVQQHPRAVGFIENEIYRNEYDARLPARPLAPCALADFPHDALAYREVPVPTTRSEAAASGVALDSRRAADIHIKIPSRCAPHATGPLAERITACERSLDPTLRDLGDCLGAAGFYRQISQSGNILYTAHFAELSTSNHVFHELTRFATTHGGIVNVVREACTDLWRKRMDTAEPTFAPIPPLLVTTSPERS